MATKTVVKYRNRSVPKHRGGGHKGFTVPLAVVAGCAPAFIDLWDHRGSIRGMAAEAGKIFVGWDYESASWSMGSMKWGTIPLIAGIIVHKLVGSKLGINRMLAQAGVPFVRI